MAMSEEEIESLHQEYEALPSILKGSFGEYITLRTRFKKEEIQKTLVNVRKMKETLKTA